MIGKYFVEYATMNEGQRQWDLSVNKCLCSNTLVS